MTVLLTVISIHVMGEIVIKDHLIVMLNDVSTGASMIKFSTCI